MSRILPEVFIFTCKVPFDVFTHPDTRYIGILHWYFIFLYIQRLLLLIFKGCSKVTSNILQYPNLNLKRHVILRANITRKTSN